MSPSTVERELRNNGLCIVMRQPQPFVGGYKETRVRTVQYAEKEGLCVRSIYETPKGELSTLTRQTAATTWTEEFLFKGPEDYKKILALIEDNVIEDNLDAWFAASQSMGEDVFLRPTCGLEPMQSICRSNVMDLETFAMEWLMNRDEIIKLHDAFARVQREIYPLVAKTKAPAANYGGNIVANLIGPETYRDYYLPHYEEAAGILHEGGRPAGLAL